MTPRLPRSAHTSRPWRINEIAPDFRLEDVWELPVRGGPDDFPRLVEAIGAMDPARGSSRASRVLFALRERLGELFGLDEPDKGLGSRVAPLRDRLPQDLRDGPSGPGSDVLPISPLYLTADEWAAEVANETVHGILHLGRVPDGSGGFRAQLAILVKPNGLLGSAYLVAIRPFRHLIVYPPLIRDIGSAWAKRSAETASARALISTEAS
jgi:hypothetical protein